MPAEENEGEPDGSGVGESESEAETCGDGVGESAVCDRSVDAVGLDDDDREIVEVADCGRDGDSGDSEADPVWWSVGDNENEEALELVVVPDKVLDWEVGADSVGDDVGLEDAVRI